MTPSVPPIEGEVVEAMTRAMETSYKPTFRRRGDPARDHSATCALSCCWEEVIPEPSVLRERMARTALEVLASPSRIPCPTCGGRGTRDAVLCNGDPERTAINYRIEYRCPDCSDGTVPGPPLVVEWLRERGMVEK